MRFRLTGWVLAALLGVASVAAARAPSKGEVGRLLGKSIQDLRSVSRVFGDLGGGRFPVLFVTRGRDCIEREVDGRKEHNCSNTSVPHAAIVQATGADLTLIAELPLPTAAAPWDQPEELTWGITQVKDWDGDGQPELLVIYGYHGPMEWGIGDTYYRDLALLNLDKPSVAVHLTLDEKPQASSSPAVESKFKFNGAELSVTRRIGEYDGDKGARVYQQSKPIWRRGADDRYTEAKVK